MKSDSYQQVTDTILAKLEEGVIPWRKPWTASDLPRNLVSKKAYRGINVFLLAYRFDCPYWLTYKQATDLGGNVKKGERGTKVLFWSILKGKEIDPKTQKPKKVFFLREWTVFNALQCEGIDDKIPATEKREFNDIPKAQGIVDNYLATSGIPAVYGGGRACYRIESDTIALPHKTAFDGEPEFYSTAFHEIIHSTGAEKRLNREGITKFDRFGSEQYSKEELIAEFGAAFLCGECGIEQSTLDNTAAYIANWKAKLTAEPKWLVQAAGAAQKASDYVLGVSYENDGNETVAPAEREELAHA